jgi:hypothetical protein
VTGLSSSTTSDHAAPTAAPTPTAAQQKSLLRKANDDAKLIFGTIFSLRNMARKLGGDDDAFISYRTGQYKLHYYETPSNLRFALLTEPGAPSMRNVLHQIYINLWVEYGESCLSSRAGQKGGRQKAEKKKKKQEGKRKADGFQDRSFLGAVG